MVTAVVEKALAAAVKAWAALAAMVAAMAAMQINLVKAELMGLAVAVAVALVPRMQKLVAPAAPAS